MSPSERKATINGDVAGLARVQGPYQSASRSLATPLKGGVTNISRKKCQPQSGRRIWQSQRYSAFQGRALERAACKKCQPRSQRRHSTNPVAGIQLAKLFPDQTLSARAKCSGGRLKLVRLRRRDFHRRPTERSWSLSCRYGKSF